MVAQLTTAQQRWPSAAAPGSWRVPFRYQTLGGKGLLAGLACYVPSLAITLLVAAPDDAFEVAVYLSALFLILAVVLSRQPADDLLRPFVWLTALYVAYTVGGVFFMTTNFRNQVSRQSEWIFAATSLVGLLGMHFGHALGLRTGPRDMARQAAACRATDPRCFLILCLAMAGLAAYPGRSWVADRFSPSRIAAYTDWAASRRAEAALDPQSGLAAYCGELCIFLLLIALLLPLFCSWKVRWLAAGAGLALVLLTVKGGHKSYALFFFSTLAVWWNYRRSRLRGWHLLAGGLAAYVAIAAFNHVRYTSSLSEMGRASWEMIRQDPTLLTPAKGGELSSGVREYFTLLDGIELGTAEITYGGTLWRDLGAFIPKAIWPDRPLPASEYYMQCFYPKEFDEGKGLGLYIVAEAYWNFGFLGVASEMALVGWFCSWIHVKLEPWSGQPVRPLLYSFALQILVIPVVRGGFILCTKTGLMFVAPVLLLLALSTRQAARRGAARPAPGHASALAVVTVIALGVSPANAQNPAPATINVSDFGAKGDGTANDTQAIQAAIDGAAGGSTVYVPGSHSYRITAGLRLSGRSHVNLFCDPGARMVAASAEFDMLTIAGDSPSATITGCSWQGAAKSTEGFAAIRSYGSFTAVTYNFITGTNNGVMLAEGADSSCLSGNTFADLVGRTSGNGYASYTAAGQTIIARNRYRNIPRHDIYVSGAPRGGGQNAVVSGNESKGNQFVAINLFATATQPALAGVSVRENLVLNCAGGIFLNQNVRGGTITGNTVASCSGTPIYLNGGTTANQFPNHNTIEGNSLVNNTDPGGNILVVNSIANLIAGNILVNALTRGISVDYTGSPSSPPIDNVVVRNSVIGNTATPVFVNGPPVTGTVVADTAPGERNPPEGLRDFRRNGCIPNASAFEKK